jgi:hypothetical protein
MAYFAQIDNNNVVINVLSIPDDEQHRGQDFLANDLQLGGKWIQTSYNNNIRKIFAGIGFIYNQELDVFLPPKPFESWTIDPIKKEWVAPIERPEDIFGTALNWDEVSFSWNRSDLPIIHLQSEQN